MGDTPRDDARALAFIEAYGRTSTAFQALSPGVSHWFDEAPGVVAYVDTGQAWVAAGEPIAPPDQAIPVAERFVAAARRAGRRASFFATEGILAASPHFQRIPLGQQPVWDPQVWDAHLREHRSLREQLRRARAKRVTVRAITQRELDGEPALRGQIDAAVRHWLASRPMPPMHFLVEVAPLLWVAHRRIFVAEQLGVVVAVLSIAPVPARRGWLFEHLLRDPRAPNGTSELLVDHAMRELANDGVTWATLGLAPLAGDLPTWMRWTRRVSRPLFNFAGLASFKRKLRPQYWEPIYLAFPAGSSRLGALLDGLRAFAGGPLWRFGVRTALRGPRPLLIAMEWLLIPWTLMLALTPTSPWFPSRAIHLSWVLFDIALYGLLRVVRQNEWQVGAVVAATAVSIDAGLTLVQASVWNVPRVRSAVDLVVIAVACTAPLLSALVLWGAARRLDTLRDVRSDTIPASPRISKPS